MAASYQSLTDFFQAKAVDNLSSIHHQGAAQHTESSFREVYELSLKVGRFLANHNVRRGENVALMSTNRIEWIAIYIGIINVGACAVTIDPHLSAHEINNIIGNSKARLLFTERNILPNIRSPELDEKVSKYVVLDADINYLRKCIPFSWIEERHDSDFKVIRSSPKNSASLIYTSGTTSNPKGVLLKHTNFLSQLSIAHDMRLSEDDKTLMLLPLNHAYSFSACLLNSLEVGADIFILSSLNKADLLECIQKNRLTTLIFVPAILNQLYRGIVEQINFAPNSAQLIFHTLKSSRYISDNGAHLYGIKKCLFKKIHDALGGNIRRIISGAAALDEDVIRTFNTLGLPIFEGYGLTETAPVIFCNFPHHARPGTVGRRLNGISVKIVSPDDNGAGEIAVKGPPVFNGYYQLNNNGSTFTSDGYFLTGDIGSLDKENYLSICGRSKDVIVLPSGKNVFPDEIEEFYLESDCIEEIAVFGVPKSTREKAEEIYAIIVPNMSYFKTNCLNDVDMIIKNTIIDRSEQLPGWCRINRYEIQYQSLPRTTTRKIKKFELRQNVIDRNGQKTNVEINISGEKLLSSGAGKLLKEAVARVKGGPIQFELESHLFMDLGFDSLSMAELAVNIEEIIGQPVSKDIVYSMRSIRDCIIAINEFCSQNEIDLSKGDYRRGMDNNNSTCWNEVLDQSISPVIDREIKQRVHLDNNSTGHFRQRFISTLSLISRIMFRLECDGIEHLPAKPPFILASNHESYMDPLFVLCKLAPQLRKFFYVIGKKEHLQRFDRGLFAWLAQMIPIDREGNFLPALQAGKKVLDSGNILFIHPEGTPSMDGKLNRFKNGVGILAEATGSPIIPIYIKGSFNVLNRDQYIPRPSKVKIIFGSPISPRNIDSPNGKPKHEFITSLIEQEIIRLGATPRLAPGMSLRRLKQHSSDGEKEHVYD